MSETGGTNAAATLSLQIETASALTNIKALNAEYMSLHANMSKKLDANIGRDIGQSVKGLQASLASVSGGILSINKALDDIVSAGGRSFNPLASGAKAAAAAVAALSAATAANASAALAGNNASTAKLLRERAEAATLAAEAEKRLAQVAASNTSAAQAAANASTAKLLRERAEAATLAAEAEKRLANAIRDNTAAAKAAYTANAQRLGQQRADTGAGKTVSSYNSLMNTVETAGPATVSSTAVKTLDSSHKSLAGSTTASASAQVNWNKVASEGHTIARGLAGSLGTLWITYGSLVPLLAGAALGSAFKQAAVVGSEFEYQLTFVKALGGESAEAVNKLSESAKRLGSEGLRGPSEIASGYRILAQAGLTATQALEAMPNALNLATVGEMEMEQAAVTLTGVMNAFNLTVADSEHVGDVFAKAAALSQTSVQGMTEAMKTASVVGEQYGASMEDTATALTLLAKVNITGTSAGTAFRNMLKELYAPVPQAAAALEKLKIKTQDVQGNLRPFADVIYDLKGKLEDFSKGDQTQILQRLFGERGGKEAVAMLSLTRAEWEKLRDSIKNSEGFMDTVANELENTAKGKWAQAVNTMKSQLITAFQEMEPVFSNLADNLKELFSNPDFVSGLKTIVSGVATLTSVLVEMAPALITLAQAWLVYKAAMIGSAVWTATAAAVTTFSASMQAASGIMGPALGVMGTMKSVVAGLPSLLMAIPTPLTIIAGGLAAGATAWMIWGNTATRAGDQAYDAAKRAESALAKVQRREKYGVGDLGEAQEELDKAEKLLSLRVEGRQTGTALSDARASVAKWGEVVAGLEKEKYKAQGASTGLKAAVEGKPATRKASEILGPSPKATKSSAVKPNKDLRKTLDENLSSAIKQEQIQLSMELLDVEIELAAQTISSVVATEKKNETTRASLEIERLLIKASLADAKAAGDQLQITKFQNDLDENAVKIKKQEKAAILDVTRATTADTVAKKDISVATERYIQDLKFERDALDLTAQQVARLRIEREKERAEADLKLRSDRNLVTPEQEAAERAAIAARAAARQEDEDDQQTYVYGWKSAYKQWADNAGSEAKRAADTFNALTGSMESALDEFLTTGKFNFAKFATDIIAQIAKIEAKALVSKAAGAMGGSSGFGGIVGSILGMFGGGGGGFSAGDFANLAASHIDFAKGGVFSDSPSLHAYANTVQTSPKTFAYGNIHKFAKGGVFAEAGPEAVMPLTRDSAGRLGVKSQGGNGGQPISIVVHVNGTNAPDVRRAAGQGAREALGALNGARRYG